MPPSARIAVTVLAVVLGTVARLPATTSCLTCHGGTEIGEGFRSDVHSHEELSCHGCHGGNPDPEVAGDMTAAKDPDYAPNPYRGVPARADVPSFCGRCHSDAERIKRFAPSLGVDQVDRYWTSRHGKALERGDENVPTCIGCHRVHRMRAATDVDSRVYPARIHETCGGCHSDAKRMAGYRDDHGDPLPVDQEARWRISVHGRAMLEEEQISAPTCNDCHGNHGAAPPGVDSVAYVCGNCHGREEELFRASPKRPALEQHASFLTGGNDCTTCHDPSYPDRDRVGGALAACTACHGNHAILRGSVAMLSPAPASPCFFCHPPGSPRDAPAAVAATQRRFLATFEGLAAEADRRRLEGAVRFDWLLEQARSLPPHQSPGGEAEPDAATFANLLEKFRLGEVHYRYTPPPSDEPVEASRNRCGTCHSPEPPSAAPHGWTTSRAFIESFELLGQKTARAVRLLARARRGGVHTKEAPVEIEKALQKHVEMAVLVHTFDADEGGKFSSAYEAAVEHADAAVAASLQALDHLEYRRRGLMVFLILTLIALVAVGLKIRQISD